MSVNKVILIGNVGKDPEVRYFDDNSAKANFSLATSERGYTMANGTVVPERTEWHNIVCWRGLAQIVEKYVKKGDPLYIEGKIRTRSYDDQNGVKRYVTEINADNIEFLSRRSNNEGGYQGADNTSQASNPIPTQQPTQTTAPTTPNLGSDEGVDDLPF
ncbi:MAG: single-stranded DNA-binding protein [Proteiniphilum sp.]|nr:single-stranded DNA-binding protein [Proteiniphilum sp.]